MIADLNPYPAMKDSGVPWLGKVPEHWKVRRLRNAAEMRVSNVDKHTKDDELPVRLCNYVDVYKHDRIRHQMQFMHATASSEEIARFRLERGDVLITKDSEAWNDIGVPALVEETVEDLICGYHLALLRPLRDRLHGEYLFRALQSTGVAYQFHVEANGVTRYGLSHAAIKSIWLPLPPLPEQSAIVRFLDHADRRIRRYIRAKQKLIKLLEEQKQAIVHRAVTRGLDSNVRLKPSGVEWLGDVPEHWGIVPLKSIAFIQSGLTLGKNYLGRTLVEFPYLRVANVQDGYLNLPEIKLVAVPEEEAVRCMLQTGDVLMTEGGDPDKLGRGCVWEGQIAPCLHQNHVFAVRPKLDRLLSQFLTALLGSQYAKTYFLRTAKQTTNLASTNKTTIGQFPVLLPRLEEQSRMLVSLEAETTEINKAVIDAHRQIALLREYLTRLIADAVTGKLDVREAAATLPDEPDEPAAPDEAEALVEGDDTAEDTDLDAAIEEADAADA